jgi:hypothetical protein
VGGSWWSLVVAGLEDPYGAGRRLDDEARRVPDTESGWALRIAAEDARAARGEPDDDALAALLDAVPADLARGVFPLWVRAIVAERSAFRLDPSSLPFAVESLAALPEGPLLSPAARHVRARLRRLLAFASLVVYEDPSVSFEHLEAALADLYHCGLAVYAAFTAAAYELIRFLIVGDDPAGALTRARQAQAVLRERASVFELEAALAVAVMAQMTGDRARFHEAVDRFDVVAGHTGGRRSVPWTATLSSALRAYGAVYDSAGGTAELHRLDDAVTVLDTGNPWVRSLALRAAAVAFLDAGALPLARDHWARAQAFPGTLLRESRHDGMVEARLRLLAGDSSATTTLKEALGSVAAAQPRLAAVQALRIGHDCRRVGEHDQAVLFRDLAVGLLPAADACTQLERSLLASLERPAPADERRQRLDPPGVSPEPRAAGVRVSLLAPRVEVVVDGRGIDLAPGTARLLVVLLVLGSPFTVDQLTESLWPDVDRTTGRRRLASALHRLRSTLGLGGHELVARRGDAVVVEIPVHWHVDLVAFRSALRSGDDQRVAQALAGVRGMAASVELAYDDALGQARHALVGAWVAAARDLCGRGAMAPAALADAAAALGLTVEDLRPGSFRHP